LGGTMSRPHIAPIIRVYDVLNLRTGGQRGILSSLNSIIVGKLCPPFFFILHAAHYYISTSSHIGDLIQGDLSILELDPFSPNAI